MFKATALTESILGYNVHIKGEIKAVELSRNNSFE